jgi:hypothetical protein
VIIISGSPNRAFPSKPKSGKLLIFLMTDGFKWLIDTQERTEEAPGGWQESVPIAAAQLYTPRGPFTGTQPRTTAFSLIP